MLKLVAALVTLGNIAAAITETIVTPAPDFAHGKLASLASLVVFVLTSF